MFEFNFHAEKDGLGGHKNVHVSGLNGDADLNAVLSMFIDFLRGCGYEVSHGDVYFGDRE